MCSIKPGGSGPNGTCCTGSTGIKSCSTAPRSRQKKGEQTGPSPVDRAKETALPLAGDGRAMPWGAVVTAANANDGGHTETLLASWTVPPPVPARPLEVLDVRGLPTAQADGADANRPNRARAEAAGWIVPPPARFATSSTSLLLDEMVSASIRWACPVPVSPTKNQIREKLRGC